MDADYISQDGINANERVRLRKVGIPRVSIRMIPFVNAFGVTDRAYEVVDTDKPYLLWEDGCPMLWEDGTNVLLEQQKQKIWLQVAKR